MFQNMMKFNYYKAIAQHDEIRQNYKNVAQKYVSPQLHFILYGGLIADR